MEDMSPAVAVTRSLGKSSCDNSGFSGQVEIKRLKLVTETASMLSNSPAMLPSPSNSVGGDSHKEIKKGISPLSISGVDEDSFDGASLSNMVSENIRSITAKYSATQVSEEDEVLSVGDEPNGLIGAELLALAAGSEMSLPASVEVIAVGDGRIIANAIIIGEHSNDKLPNGDVVMQDGPSAVNASAVAIQLPKEKGHGGGIRSVFELDCIPLWGSISIRGERPEMEDAIASVPRLLKIPIKMLIGDRVVEGLSHSLTHQTTHFFGVYDGHGGSQVSNYCRDRIHSALVEEINSIEASFANGLIGENWQAQWEKAFTGCFQKVDDEIGDKTGQDGNEGSADVSEATFEPLAPETVGSTAVVALVCASHIIVANCGDSRAVLCRGKEAMALSVDHKPNREDEYARIEAVGGKVIQWNGYRVLGVLAMSRSIGDRYLKPSIIAEPEVLFVPRAREDECLILASDGLWDVMSNEEVCEVARKKIWLWHKKNGVTPIGGRGNGIDPAAQAAADYLCFLAQQRGSTDNISVIVVDLKAQRKFKSKS